MRIALNAAAFFLPALFLLCLPVSAAEREVLRANNLTVVFPSSLRTCADEVLSLFPSVCGELKDHLGFEVDFHSTVVLVADSSEFERMTGSSMVVALAVPRRYMILIDRPRSISHPHRLHALLKHELCHLLLHDRIPGGSLPRWLDEGVAQWVSGGFAEVVLPRRGSVLDESFISGRIIPLQSLSRGFYGDERSVLLAYEQSLSLVQFIVDRYGTDGLLSLLKGLAEGASFEDALLENLSLTTASLEEAWIEDLKGKGVWVALLIGHLYEILFVLGAAVLAAGFVRHIRKKRAQMEALDDPE